MQDTAKIIERSGIHWFVFAEFVDNGTGNVMGVDQGIGGFRRVL